MSVRRARRILAGEDLALTQAAVDAAERRKTGLGIIRRPDDEGTAFKFSSFEG